MRPRFQPPERPRRALATFGSYEEAERAVDRHEVVVEESVADEAARLLGELAPSGDAADGRPAGDQPETALPRRSRE